LQKSFPISFQKYIENHTRKESILVATQFSVKYILNYKIYKDVIFLIEFDEKALLIEM
jgi:hypothetical protein